MPASSPKLYQLNQYKVLDYFMTHVDLELNLSKQPECSKAKLTIKPNPQVLNRSNELRLDGEFMILTSLKLNDRILKENEYLLTEDALIIKNIPNDQIFYVETSSTLSQSTDLFGLYQTDNIYLVKAETEGLRRVFFCIDRPDNLATYTTTIIANKKQYPTLLSNGDLINKDEDTNGLHWVTWHDNLAKPSYLFAVVAGNLNYSNTQFTRKNGTNLAIEFYVSSKDSIKCLFAQEVLKKSMAWDEQVFNLDCELNQHKVAGVDKYASGASEPTGLNLFNTENLFATAETKTDLGILRVLEVVAHEFFHYWTGNRVTIRDWFNLTFKEGLTTFRAAQFCEDLLGTDLARLINGKNLDERAPRQHTYTAVRSLYTVAAYEKGADVFRMMMLVVGKDLFYKRLSMFLKEYDGKAVTIEDLLDYLTQTTGFDMHSFLPWFTEPGIPKLNISDHYDAEKKEYHLEIKTLNAGGNKPIPIVMGLLDVDGNELIEEQLLLVNSSDMTFSFSNITHRPIPSLLRSFSAPVYLSHTLSNKDLLVLIQFDSNLYNRCEASKQLQLNLIKAYCSDTTINYPKTFFSVYRTLLHNKELEPWILAELLTLSSEEDLIMSIDNPQLELIAKARTEIQKTIAHELKEDWSALLSRLNDYQFNTNMQFNIFDIRDAGMRRLQDVYYSYMQYIDHLSTRDALIEQFQNQLPKNMTETIASLNCLGAMECEKELDEALMQFYEYWKNDTHAINYWFRLQAALHSSTVVARVQKLLEHPAFDILNPNKIYSLFGTFILNPYGFHNKSGEGYKLVAQLILMLDQLNPPLAANLVHKFIYKEQYDEQRKQYMYQYLVLIEKEAHSIDVKNAVRKLITD